MRASILSLLCLAFTMPGCSAPVASHRAAIVGGSASNEDSAVVLVMSIWPSGMAGFGTGTLIAPDLVLTARHVVQDNPAGAVANCALVLPSPAGRNNRVYIGQSFQRSELQAQPGIAATSIVPPGDYTLCNGDIALLRLASPVDIAPAALNMELFLVADPVVVVGYGRIDPTVAPNPRRRMQGTGFVREQANPLVEIQARACHGDSGGPIFDARGNMQGVLGFTRTNNCVISGGLPLGRFQDWLRAHIAESYARHPTRPQPAPRFANGTAPSNAAETGAPDAGSVDAANVGADAASGEVSSAGSQPATNTSPGGGCQTQRVHLTQQTILLCSSALVWLLWRYARRAALRRNPWPSA